MRVRVVAVGKLRDRGLEALCEEFRARAAAFFPVAVDELRSLAALRKHLEEPGIVHVLLDERGWQPDTRALADWFDNLRADGARALHLYLGDADGFDDADRARAARVLSLSRLTLPHRLARLVVLEQIYRVASLLAGHPYHRE
ncbi:MAG: 23S rRNA (pseudouridine(1915)-N(3))-methyltransferase RlmH [Nannocystaceae bacterium]|nr:23S rRNA (pseudouridine(1915)-N(3))-methyltransferase RlmH [Myxococcales bacterium]